MLLVALALHLLLCFSWAQIVLLREIFFWGFELEITGYTLGKISVFLYTALTLSLLLGENYGTQTQNHKLCISNHNVVQLCRAEQRRCSEEMDFQWTSVRCSSVETLCWRRQVPLLHFNSGVYLFLAVSTAYTLLMGMISAFCALKGREQVWVESAWRDTQQHANPEKVQNEKLSLRGKT